MRMKWNDPEVIVIDADVKFDTSKKGELESLRGVKVVRFPTDYQVVIEFPPLMARHEKVVLRVLECVFNKLVDEKTSDIREVQSETNLHDLKDLLEDFDEMLRETTG